MSGQFPAVFVALKKDIFDRMSVHHQLFFWWVFCIRPPTVFVATKTDIKARKCSLRNLNWVFMCLNLTRT